MAFTKPEKAFCILEFAKTESWTLVQRAFRTKHMRFLSISEIPQRWPCFVLCPRKLSTGHSFFFEGAKVNGETYLDMLEKWLMDNLSEKESDDFIFQQDGVPPHLSLRVRQFLNTTHFQIDELDGLGEMIAFSCPGLPGLQISHPAISFCGGWFVKGLVYMPLLPKDVDELKARITEAVATIDNTMLERVWEELDYGLMCAVWPTVLILNTSEQSMKNLRLQAFRIH